MLVRGPRGCSAELTVSSLLMRDGRSPERRVQLTEVLTAKVVDGKTLTIHFVDLKEPKLRVKKWSMEADAEKDAEEFADSFKNCLRKEFPDRPKKILAFVNPACGFFKGLSIFHEEVEPIFNLCGVEIELIITRHHGESRSILWRRRLEDIDAVLVVGGDGSFTDAAQGLLERAQIDAGISKGIDPRLDDADFSHGDDDDAVRLRHAGGALVPAPSTDWTDVEFASPRLPIVHIPGGSGNGYATVAAGVHDPVTSAIHAALGHVMSTDVASFALLSTPLGTNTDPLKSPSSFAGFAVLMGGVTNLDLAAMEKIDIMMRKWFGPFRHFIYPFMMPKMDPVRVRVRYLEPDNNAAAPEVCRADCRRCAQENEAEKTGASERRWKEQTVEEKNMVIYALTPLRHRFARFGVLPFSHAGDGLLDLVSLDGPKVGTILHYGGHLINDFLFLDSTRYSIASSELVMEAAAGASKDPLFLGMEETVVDLKQPVHIRVHRKLLKTFGMGMRDRSGEPVRPSMSVGRFLLGKAVKVVVVVVVVVVAWRKGVWRGAARWVGEAAREGRECLGVFHLKAFK